VIVFQHGSSGRVNIIYRRPDGNVGWVDPPVVNSPNRHWRPAGRSLWSAAFEGPGRREWAGVGTDFAFGSMKNRWKWMDAPDWQSGHLRTAKRQCFRL